MRKTRKDASFSSAEKKEKKSDPAAPKKAAGRRGIYGTRDTEKNRLCEKHGRSRLRRGVFRREGRKRVRTLRRRYVGRGDPHHRRTRRAGRAEGRRAKEKFSGVAFLPFRHAALPRRQRVRILFCRRPIDAAQRKKKKRKTAQRNDLLSPREREPRRSRHRLRSKTFDKQ